MKKEKLAEQRATKRLKKCRENVQKDKTNIKKRELKLTVSRALSDDDIEKRGRSLAFRRAKQKENKEINKNEKDRKI